MGRACAHGSAALGDVTGMDATDIAR
ncbi:MAG: hypothetical protein JWO42_3282, partial [Chloroflexi bacterium]|nr:hypothetical protein [Chloroflexota bacterium]